MPHDNRITIRLTPRQITALRTVVQECLRFAASTHMHGIPQADIRLATDALDAIPSIGPAYTDHHAELTTDGWVVRAEKSAEL